MTRDLCTKKNMLFAPYPFLMAAALFIALFFSPPQILAQEKDQALRFGILSLAPPAKIFSQWQDFADYLSTALQRDVKIIVPKGFKKIKKNIEDNKIDLFYVNSLIYYKLSQEGKAAPVAQMQNLLGETTSNSVLFVRSDAGISSIKELRGEKIAFVSPMGAGGYLAPRAKLYSEGIGTQTKEVFTKNLTSSIHKVLLGDVKAGTMCGLNFELMRKRIQTGELKIISTSDDYPENVIGIRQNLPDALRKKISTIIIGMDKDPKGRKILDDMNRMKIQKFVKYDKKSEKITRDLLITGKF